MIQSEDILKVMGAAAKTVCDTVYPQYRPNAVTKGLREFIVVSMPYSVVNKMLGEDDDWWLDQTVVFDMYVADKKGAEDPKLLNLEAMKAMREGVIGLFPIVDKSLGIKITRPRIVIPAATDGNGYHYSRIQAKMSTMV